MFQDQHSAGRSPAEGSDHQVEVPVAIEVSGADVGDPGEAGGEIDGGEAAGGFTPDIALIEELRAAGASRQGL